MKELKWPLPLSSVLARCRRGGGLRTRLRDAKAGAIDVGLPIPGVMVRAKKTVKVYWAELGEDTFGRF